MRPQGRRGSESRWCGNLKPGGASIQIVAAPARHRPERNAGNGPSASVKCTDPNKRLPGPSSRVSGPWLIRLHPRPDGRLGARGGVRATDNAFLLIAIAADEVHNNQVVADRM